MADEMTEHAQPASTGKSTAAHAAAAGARPPSTTTPLVPEQRQFPDQRDAMLVSDEGQQSHGVPPQIRETMFQATIEEADPAGFADESAEHAVSAATAVDITAAHDDVAVVHVSSEQEDSAPEHEAVQPLLDDEEEEESHSGMVASPLVGLVAQLGALIHRVADLDGYDDRESRELVVHALEEGLLPGFPHPHEYSNQTTATAHAAADAQAQDDEHEQEDEEEGEGADDDDQLPEESARDHFGLDGYTDAAQQMVQLALMVTRRVRLRRLEDMFRNGGFDGLPSDRNGVAFDELPSYRNGGFGAVPASAAAVAGLEKRTFHAGGGGGDDDHGCGGGLGGCAICFDEEFEEGQEISVMPCSRAHAFHTQCITEWLGQSNMCPLCRHALPTSED